MSSTSSAARLAMFLRTAGMPGPHLGRLAQGHLGHRHAPPSNGRQEAWQGIAWVWHS